MVHNIPAHLSNQWPHMMSKPSSPTTFDQVLAACRDEDIEALQEAVDAGFDLNTSHDSWTPLHEAVIHWRPKACAFILANGGNPNARDTIGSTPLHCAVVQNGQKPRWDGSVQLDAPAMIDMLVKYGASFEILNLSGRAPLQVATIAKLTAQVEALLKAGCPPDVRGPHERSSLQLAASNGDVEICHKLVNHGADLNLVTDGMRAEDWAGSFQHQALCGELRAIRQSLKARSSIEQVLRDAATLSSRSGPDAHT